MDNDKKYSELIVIMSLKDELERYKGLIKKYQGWVTAGVISICVLAVGIVAFAVMAFSKDDSFFAVDAFGSYTQVHAYEQPNLSREMRAQHAEHIVRTLNSLDFMNYKATLENLESFFMPATWRGYIKAMEEQSLFERIETRNIKFTPSIGPHRVIANNSNGTVYSDPECYKTIILEDGTEISADCRSTSIEAGGHSETYEFPVKRDLYTNARLTKSESFVVRLTLTKMDSGARKNGYIVTKYEERY